MKGEKEGAHECIRPTRAWDRQDLLAYLQASGRLSQLSPNHLKLYELIFKKFITSQMKSVKVKIQRIKVENSKLNIIKEVEFPVQVLDRGYDLALEDEFAKTLIKTKFKDSVYKILPTDKSLTSKPKEYPFTQASLIFEMKKRGIGRPSTYAVIVDRLFKRKYVIQKGLYILPSSLGIKVYNFLNSLTLSDPFLKDEFTRQLEAVMDKVEQGEEDWEKVLKDLYKTLLPFSSQARADKDKQKENNSQKA